MGKGPDVDLEEFWVGALKIHWGIEARLSKPVSYTHLTLPTIYSV